MRCILISVCNREIMSEEFDSYEDAKAAMHEEMIRNGYIPEELINSQNEYQDYEYGFGEDYGYSNIGIGDSEYDWRIIFLDT